MLGRFSRKISTTSLPKIGTGGLSALKLLLAGNFKNEIYVRDAAMTNEMLLNVFLQQQLRPFTNISIRDSGKHRSCLRIGSDLLLSAC